MNLPANINYYLKDGAGGPVRIEILDDQRQYGEHATRNRKTRHQPGGVEPPLPGRPEEAKLRTKPPGNPHVVEEKRFRTTWEREGWYPVLSWGTGGGFQGFMVAPGTYTVKLTVGGEEFTQDLEVRKDPRSDGNPGRHRGAGRVAARDPRRPQHLLRYDQPSRVDAKTTLRPQGRALGRERCRPKHSRPSTN